MTYYYPSKFLGWDLVTIFMYLIIDQTRLLLGRQSFCFFILFQLLFSFTRKQDFDYSAIVVVGGVGPAYYCSTCLLHGPSNVHVRFFSYHIIVLFLSYDFRLRVDIVINAIALFFVGSELLLGLLVIVNVFLASRKF